MQALFGVKARVKDVSTLKRKIYVQMLDWILLYGKINSDKTESGGMEQNGVLWKG